LYNLEWWEILGAWNSIINRLNKQNETDNNYIRNQNRFQRTEKEGQKTQVVSYFRRKDKLSPAAQAARDRILRENG
jgi:uncharacterized protein YkuJ